MTETHTYKCDICGTTYADRYECLGCENRHKKIKRIGHKFYVSKEKDVYGFPTSIEVEFEGFGNLTAWYDIRK